MDNHFHFLIEIVKERLSRIIPHLEAGLDDKGFHSTVSKLQWQLFLFFGLTPTRPYLKFPISSIIAATRETIASTSALRAMPTGEWMYRTGQEMAAALTPALAI